MNTDQIQSQLRLIFIFIGAILAKKGLIESPSTDVIEAILGIGFCLGSLVWSYLHQKRMKTITEEERQQIIKEYLDAKDKK